MNESKITQSTVDAAVDAVLAKRDQGQLLGTKSSVALRLRQRISDLKSLNGGLSAATIASELTQAGLPVSTSTVQRVLREEAPATKRKRPEATPTDAGKLKATNRSPPVASGSGASSQVATRGTETTDAAALLKKLQEEAGLPDAVGTKKAASLKTK